MDHNHNPVTSRSEAERLLGVSEKLLRNRDLPSAKDFAVLAQETEPLLEGPEQILAIIEVLLAAEKRVSNTNRDWYAILQVAPRTDDFELIKRQYRRLALLLHPDKNKFPFADSAFQFVADAWAILSDAGKKSSLDSELTTLFTKVDLMASKKVPVHRGPGRPRGSGNASGSKSNQKLPVRRSAAGGTRAGGGSASGGKRTPPHSGSGVFRSGTVNFWTSCPYCYNLYEYPREYEECCLKCQNCRRVFTAVGVMSMPPTVPGREAYYFCWGVFPMGFAADGKNSGGGFANWVPPMSAVGGVENGGEGGREGNGNVNVNEKVVPNANMTPMNSEAPKKRGRGRPRKNL